MTSWAYIPQLLVSGLTLGAIYALVAIGFVTISRASQIVNFAQGEFVMLGGVLTFFFLKKAGLPYPVASLAAIVFVVLIGFLLYRLVIHPLRKASVLILMMATLGASFFLSSASGLTFGSLPKIITSFLKASTLRSLWSVDPDAEPVGLDSHLSPARPPLSSLRPNASR